MKRIIVYTAVLLGGILQMACNAPSTPKNPAISFDTTRLTTIAWEDTSLYIGNIEEGEKVKVQFGFKNTGNFPLLILSANAGCGCTVTHIPEKPIAIGDSGTIEAVFNSANQAGEVKKYITITANTLQKTEYRLTFAGTVLKK